MCPCLPSFFFVFELAAKKKNRIYIKPVDIK